MHRIDHAGSLPAYRPPGHSDTRNVRLVDKGFCGRFEMILGEIAPGGAADAHSHADEHQVIYILAGTAEVILGDEPARTCGPGTIIRIPPRLTHAVTAKGEEPLKLIVLYSPPLPPREERPIPDGPDGPGDRG